MDRVTELTSEPVVGERYAVPCVRYYPGFRDCVWIPVMGPLHDDAEIIGFEPRHWHIDWRFMTDEFMRARIPGWWEVHQSCWLGIPISVKNYGRDSCPDQEPRDRLLCCVRRMPTFSPVIKRDGRSDPVKWLAPLEDAYADKRLGACRVCPHRGMPLASQPVVDGVVVCPAHGLCFDVTTGRLVPRVKKETP